MDNTKKQRIISICTGYGGIELGLELAGLNFRTVAYVEIEAFATWNLVKKMEEKQMDAAPIFTNLKTFPFRKFCGKVHGLIGGYPCQPFSSAGKRKGEDDPRHLWPFIANGILECRPDWVFFENVEGHLSKGIVQVLSDLEEMGYRSKVGIFSAEEVGATHRRKRVFIMAYNDSERIKELNRQIASKKEQYSARDTRWPARPGQKQYEWEEPRVI